MLVTALTHGNEGRRRLLAFDGGEEAPERGEDGLDALEARGLKVVARLLVAALHAGRRQIRPGDGTTSHGIAEAIQHAAVNLTDTHVQIDPPL